MNLQRENFKKKVGEQMKAGAADSASSEGPSGGGDIRVEDHGDGTVSVHHGDGETTGPHPSMAHAAMQMIAKHQGGEHGHIEPHPGGGATTHHVSMDGEVQGPVDHESEDEAYNHLKGSVGEGCEMAGDPAADAGGEDSSFE